MADGGGAQDMLISRRGASLIITSCPMMFWSIRRMTPEISGLGGDLIGALEPVSVVLTILLESAVGSKVTA